MAISPTKGSKGLGAGIRAIWRLEEGVGNRGGSKGMSVSGRAFKLKMALQGHGGGYEAYEG